MGPVDSRSPARRTPATGKTGASKAAAPGPSLTPPRSSVQIPWDQVKAPKGLTSLGIPSALEAGREFVATAMADGNASPGLLSRAELHARKDLHETLLSAALGRRDEAEKKFAESPEGRASPPPPAPPSHKPTIAVDPHAAAKAKLLHQFHADLVQIDANELALNPSRQGNVSATGGHTHENFGRVLASEFERSTMEYVAKPYVDLVAKHAADPDISADDLEKIIKYQKGIHQVDMMLFGDTLDVAAGQLAKARGRLEEHQRQYWDAG